LRRAEEIYYLDTSTLVKRYFEEPGSENVDSMYGDAYRSVKTLSFSYWNIADAVVVFDKYAGKPGAGRQETGERHAESPRPSRDYIGSWLSA
jgi:predicted nucleic acid-binding protein